LAPGASGAKLLLMKSSLIQAVLAILIIGVALAFRLPGLNLRPMHHDEANQAVKCGVLQETGVYRYDAGDHHGPSLYYITLPFAWMTSGRNFAGTSESTFRLVPVIFGIGAIILLLLFREGMGRPALLVSAGLMAISPAMVYYSRFYIQEMLLVFFTLGAVAAGWRYFKRRTVLWAAAAGFFAGMMFVTKETVVIAYAAMAGGLLLTYFRERGRAGVQADAYGSTQKVPTGVLDSGHILAFLAAAVVVSVIFFSSFFTNWKGPLDAIIAFKGYAGKSAGSSHEHPWYYYLQLLAFWKTGPGPAWSEGLILLLALAGAIAIFLNKAAGDRLFLRFLAVYTILITAAYSVIPYKTPWCLLSFLSGMILLAGVGAISLFTMFRANFGRMVVVVLLVAGGVNLARQSWGTNFVYQSDPRNPYVYSHTVGVFMRLVERVETLSLIHPEGKKMLIAVIAPPSETWPLPWYLRGYGTTGYWVDAKDLPEGIHPAIVVASAGQKDPVRSRLAGDYQEEYYGLRPDVLLTVLISRDLWDKFISEGGVAGVEKKYGLPVPAPSR